MRTAVILIEFDIEEQRPDPLAEPIGAVMETLHLLPAVRSVGVAIEDTADALLAIMRNA